MGWATVVSCDVACHVMSFDVLVMSFDVMWLLVLCHVTWCNAMSCDVRSCEELSSVVPCNGMECYELKTPLFSQQLLCTTKSYSSTTPVLQSTTLCYQVLLQYYTVIQSTTPVLLCTTKYYSSTTQYYKDSDTSPYYKVLLQYLSGHPYYKVLLQYYSVPQSTTPVLLCTTRYYCYSVLNSTTYYSCTSHAPTSPNAAPAAQNDCHDWSCSHMKRYLMLFTMREAAQDTLQLHQMLHLPRKMTVMIDRAHIWNAIDNARSSARHPPTSPNAAPATQNYCHDWSCSHMKRHLQSAVQQASSSDLTKYCARHAKWVSWLIVLSYDIWKRHLECPEQQAPPSNLTKYCACHAKIAIPNLREICRKRLKCHFQCATDPRMIRPWSDHENANRNPPRHRGYFFRARQEQILLKIATFPAPAIIPHFTKCCTCHEKWHRNFAECCACHEKWRMNFTQRCTCQEKWHMNFTKCCTCHEKWHMNFTKCCTCHEKWHMNFTTRCTCHQK